MLALALTARQFSTRPSSLLRFEDEVVALDFDNCAAMKLQQWDDERTAAMWGNGEADKQVRFESGA